MSRFDVEKFEPPPDPELVCCICTFVLDKPMESPCQHVFCKQCIETWLGQRRTCPTCRKKVSKRDLKPVLPLVQNMLNKLTMVCDFQENGCPVKPPLELYSSHIAKCDFELLTCRYSKCKAQILRRDMTKHESEVCEFREVLCLRQCGLHIPIRDMDSHDCMLALKKHAEERQRHAEELEARLQQLMSLQQSLRQDVETLRRQVEQERQRRPSQDGWSSSSWDSWDDDDQNTTGFFESDSEPPVDNSQLSTDSNASLDHASRDIVFDSDLENGRNSRTWRRPRPLSTSSNNSDDLEIVEEVVPNGDNSVAPNTRGGETTVSEVIEFVNEGEDSVVNGEGSAVTGGALQSAEGGSGDQILAALDVVRDFVDSVFTQNQMVEDFVDSQSSQNLNAASIQQLLQQISYFRQAFSGVSDLNVSSTTWEAVCRFLKDIVFSLLRLRTNQSGWYVANTPMSSTPMQNEVTDSSSMIQNSISSAFTSSMVTESDRCNITATTESELSENNAESTQVETWSLTDSSLNSSFVTNHVNQSNMCLGNGQQLSEGGIKPMYDPILPLTSDVTSAGGVLTASHSIEIPTSRNDQFMQSQTLKDHMNAFLREVESDDILDLITSEEDRDRHLFPSFQPQLKESSHCARKPNILKNQCRVLPSATVLRSNNDPVFNQEMIGPSEKNDRTGVPSDESCICISSTEDLEEGDDTGLLDINRRDISAGDNIMIKDEGVIPSSYPEVSQRYLPLQREFERARGKLEAIKRRHSASERALADPIEPYVKTRRKIGEAKDFLTGIKEELISSLSGVSKHEQGTDVCRLNSKAGRSRPVSCTVTSSCEAVPVFSQTRLDSANHGASHLHSQKKGNRQAVHSVTDTESTANRSVQQLECILSSSQRRRQVTETVVQPQQCSDVPIPPQTAQLLIEYNEESDSSWEPGNSDVEQSDDMSLTDDVDTDSSYEVQIPKPLYQIIEEMAAEDEDSDDSWTPS